MTITALAFVALTSSCSSASRCPQSVDQAVSGDFPVITDVTVVAIGRAVRYVDASSRDSRGYDLDIRRTFSGSLSANNPFLRTANELPGVLPGQAVLILAQPGPSTRVVVPGACDPLRPIDEAKLLRGRAVRDSSEPGSSCGRSERS
jgi:hypothetical protein